MAILSIGFACFDQFFFLNEWPQENTKNFCHDFIESGGGPAANAAWLLGLWGEEVYYMGICSRTFTVSALSMSLPRRGWIPARWFSLMT
ncbi:putative kinase [Klebsiella pneumoniae]|nr:putative kinase [Klebsiella pneumoniae]